MSPEDALQAAKLAAMVGGQLKTIDQYATSRGSAPPANKINMNSFVAQVKDPRIKAAPARYLTEVPAGFAEPLPEDYVQNQVPDVIPQYTPQSEYIPQQNQTIPAAMINDIPVNLKLHPLPSATPFAESIIDNNVKSILTRSDVDSIRNSLKNIDKSLSGMLTLLKNSKISQ